MQPTLDDKIMPQFKEALEAAKKIHFEGGARVQNSALLNISEFAKNAGKSELRLRVLEGLIPVLQGYAKSPESYDFKHDNENNHQHGVGGYDKNICTILSQGKPIVITKSTRSWDTLSDDSEDYDQGTRYEVEIV